MAFRLATFDDGGTATPGIVVGDGMHPLPALAGIDTSSIRGVLQNWDRAQPLLAAFAAAPTTAGRPIGSVRLLAPLPDPGAIFCAGANFYDHQAEMLERIARMTGKPVVQPPKAERPWFFMKTPRQSVVGPDAEARIPARSHKLDYEVELAAIIGTPARNVTRDAALGHVAGYTCVNDLSARDLSTQEDRANTRMHADWVGHKCFDDSLPMGPWIVPAADIGDPLDLNLRLSINGVEKQNGNTRDMIHDIAEQIVALSERLTLMPGDVIATGTPAGVGAGRGRDGEFLRAGDVVTIEIENIGTLTTRMIAGV